MTLPTIRIPDWPQADEREAELLRMVLESAQWGGFHPFVAEFEKSFASYQHATYGISAFNGTVTLELALEILGIGPGDEVIVPAISFISTATAVARVGAIPVFVDLEPWSFNMDPCCVAKAVSAKTKAMMAVHFGGTMCDVERLAGVCRDFGLILIEDAAHAQGGEWDGKRAGSFGVAGSFSFQNGKVLCAGEGGMLVSLDQKFAESARSVANCGRIPGRSFYEHHRLGSNLRMTGFQAAVLLAQFERLPEQIETRTANACLLKQLLADVEEITWQEQASAITQNPFYLLPGRLRTVAVSRNRFCEFLTQSGVPCTPFYPHTLPQNPLFREVDLRITGCPIAEACVQDAFWFPHRMLLADSETIAAIAGRIKAALAQANERVVVST